MKQLVEQAMVGTRRPRPGESRPHESVSRLIGRCDASDEWRLLLLAGVESIYRLAGARFATVPAPEPATGDSGPVISEAAADLVERMLEGEYEALLEPTLGRIARAGLRLPAGLLPEALSQRTHRPLWRRVLGPRARWLAGQRREWSWLLDAAERDDIESEVSLFREGRRKRRFEALKRVRAADAQRGRELLQQVWGEEKAKVRRALLRALEVELGPDDIDLLEGVLDDRAKTVARVAAELLAHLPESPYGRRMCERADAMVALEGTGRLVLSPPEELEAEWRRDRVEDRAPEGIGRRDWWLHQVVRTVPPAHWEERWRLGPGAILERVPADEWVFAEALTLAAVIHRSDGWYRPLWRWWQALERQDPGQSERSRAHRSELVDRMPGEELRELARRCLRSGEERLFLRLLRRLSPCGVALGRLWLGRFREVVGGQAPRWEEWLESLEDAAYGVPVEVLEELPPGGTAEDAPLIRAWRSHPNVQRRLRWALAEVQEIVKLRRFIMEEIPV